MYQFRVLFFYLIFCCRFLAVEGQIPKMTQLGDSSGKHLFILSGQSNMARLKPEDSFIPTVTAAFGEENVIVVKQAKGSQPIRKWYKEWFELAGTNLEQADLYDSLMSKVYQAIEGERIATVSFIWVQGERDAREKLGDLYEASLRGLYQQLADDLDRNDMNFIIARLSDYGLTQETYPDWNKIREVQVSVGESHRHYAWVNTDDLNDIISDQNGSLFNDLHMSPDGYIELGKRLAIQAIERIRSNQD